MLINVFVQADFSASVSLTFPMGPKQPGSLLVTPDKQFRKSPLFHLHTDAKVRFYKFSSCCCSDILLLYTCKHENFFPQPIFYRSDILTLYSYHTILTFNDPNKEAF